MLTCFKCHKELKDYHKIQPMNGLAFETRGHYGSTFFDPMDGSKIEIVICDDCLENNKDYIYGKVD